MRIWDDLITGRETFMLDVEKVETRTVVPRNWGNPYFTDDNDHVVIVKHPSGNVHVNYCSAQYNLVRLRDWLPFFESALSDEVDFDAEYVSHDYSKFYATYTVKERFDTPLGDMGIMFTLYHSYNGKLRTHVDMGVYVNGDNNRFYGFPLSIPGGGRKTPDPRELAAEVASHVTLAGQIGPVSSGFTYPSAYYPLALNKDVDVKAVTEGILSRTGYPRRLLRKVPDGLRGTRSPWEVYKVFNSLLFNEHDPMHLENKVRVDRDIFNYLSTI